MPPDKDNDNESKDINYYRLIAADIARKVAREEIETGAGKVARDVVKEELADTFRNFGVDIKTDAGLRRHRDVLDWARRSYDRSETLGKRVLTAIGAFAAVGTMLGGVIKFVLDYIANNHGGPIVPH